MIVGRVDTFLQCARAAKRLAPIYAERGWKWTRPMGSEDGRIPTETAIAGAICELCSRWRKNSRMLAIGSGRLEVQRKGKHLMLLIQDYSAEGGVK